MDVPMRLPDLATTGSDVRVIRWLVDIGSPVRRGQPLLEVETDKAVMELESVVTGTLSAVAVVPGDAVATGQVIATFDAEEAPGAVAANGLGTADGDAKPAAAAPATSAPLPYPQLQATSSRVSFFARNRQARASGRAASPSPAAVELGVPRRTLARRMRESKQTIPHFYLQTSANAGPMAARRGVAPGRKVAWDAFFVHAAGKALKRFEGMNYRFEDDRLVPQGVHAVGVAVDLDGDLFTVAVDDPSGKSPEQISDEIRAAVERLRGGDPRARMARRASMTISNLGSANVESFVAVINPPEAAILAVGKVRPEVVAIDGLIGIQNRVTLTLSADHRVVNGKYAADFLGAIVEELEAFGIPDGG